MKIKRFNEMMMDEFNYDHIIRDMRKNHGWGNGCINYTDDFEFNTEYFLNPDNDNDYAEQFHIYLSDLQAGQLRGELQNTQSLRQGKWKLGIQVDHPVSIYSKLT